MDAAVFMFTNTLPNPSLKIGGTAIDGGTREVGEAAPKSKDFFMI
jgi:hypothetical protein